MDGCVRAGSWLDLTEPWEMVEGGAELRPCLEAIQRGSYFPGSGFAVFNVSGETPGTWPNTTLRIQIFFVFWGFRRFFFSLKVNKEVNEKKASELVS